MNARNRAAGSLERYRYERKLCNSADIRATKAIRAQLAAEHKRDEALAELARLQAELAEMTSCRDAALRALHRDGIETDIDVEEAIANALHGPGWDWEDERTPGRIARDVAPAVRPALAKATQQLAAIAALADRWDNALAVDKPYARALRSALTAEES
jgi:hypothetical protein